MTRVHCPGCGASSQTDQELREQTLQWACDRCRTTFQIRIVFFPRPSSLDVSEFVSTVERALEEEGLSRTELARLLDVTPAYVSTLLSGRRQITNAVAQRVLHALKIAPMPSSRLDLPV